MGRFLSDKEVAKFLAGVEGHRRRKTGTPTTGPPYERKPLRIFTCTECTADMLDDEIVKARHRQTCETLFKQTGGNKP